MIEPFRIHHGGAPPSLSETLLAVNCCQVGGAHRLRPSLWLCRQLRVAEGGRDIFFSGAGAGKLLLVLLIVPYSYSPKEPKLNSLVPQKGAGGGGAGKKT